MQVTSVKVIVKVKKGGQRSRSPKFIFERSEVKIMRSKGESRSKLLGEIVAPFDSWDPFNMRMFYLFKVWSNSYTSFGFDKNKMPHTKKKQDKKEYVKLNSNRSIHCWPFNISCPSVWLLMSQLSTPKNYNLKVWSRKGSSLLVQAICWCTYLLCVNFATISSKK